MAVNLTILAGSLIIILAGAKIFTNGVEWLGKKFNLSEGAVGSVLAAVGTAMPETLVPLIAILFGPSGTAVNVGIGAILGAPFMLSTLAFGVVGVSKVFFCRRNGNGKCIEVKNTILMRDLKYFLFFYTLALAAAFIPLSYQAAKIPVALVLVAGYIYYVNKTLSDGKGLSETDLEPLYLAKKNPCPPLLTILAQTAAGLVLIASGAHYFVGALDLLATVVMIPALLLSLIITPIATELPEKFNSVIWVKGGKDTLAMGNITGAMVFQGSILPAVGILFTPWLLNQIAALSALLALLSSTIVYLFVRKQKQLKVAVMLYPVAIYGIFIFLVFTTLL
ncbi:MAG: Ca2+/Na+ antiporter [Pelotomaculum thermopropionicum]|uniref:Ca2+/Na+ antiporter n=1 Tax=Pelotomaculum thermopropionicum TaxID=110500 RepID=A0A101HQA6_9FIRM|nr:MAG: Ca2+/Na+ antiporter [Pelotomaculum thermopropionicum]